MDTVGRIVEQWGIERPDLDVSALEVVGRLSRSAALVQARLDEVFAEYGLQDWEFDVLATLRRQGEPYELTPGELGRALIRSSGTTTHRLQRLESRGFIARRQDPEDGRVQWVCLTRAGREVQEAAHAAHAANELDIVAGLSQADAAALKRGLVALAHVLEEDA